jgi:hypothetical protein
MRDHLIVLRVRAESTFAPTRRSVRAALEAGAEAWGGDFRIVSLSPVPADRYIKKRRAPTAKSFPLIDIMEGRNG